MPFDGDPTPWERGPPPWRPDPDPLEQLERASAALAAELEATVRFVRWALVLFLILIII